LRDAGPSGRIHTARGTRLRWICPLAVAPFALSGCGDQSTLSPHSPASHDIAVLWWWMLGIAGVVFLGACAMLFVGWVRRSRPGLPLVGENERVNTGLVLIFGIAVPVVVLVALFGVADLWLVGKTGAPARGSTSLTVRVVGHQWFWEVRYPGTRAVTANEIHIPVRTRVQLVAQTADVIHSFWVPQLNRKIDMIPGQANRLLLYADKPGVYRGQCAEFCGLQHAHMGMRVFAESPRRFHSWLADVQRPATSPATAAERRGRRVFLSNACASCHTIRGTSARGNLGPDLTHVASRTTLAAATIPNTPQALERWIEDPQHVKPGNKMPALDLPKSDFRALRAYLDNLR
jgi:cytochrome c oxidase subunit II